MKNYRCIYMCVPQQFDLICHSQTEMRHYLSFDFKWLDGLSKQKIYMCVYHRDNNYI